MSRRGVGGAAAGMAAVVEAEGEVEGDEGEVEGVEGHDPVAVVEPFVDEAAGVAQQDDGEEETAFAVGTLGAEGFGDRYGPAGAEAYQHGGFPYAHVGNLVGWKGGAAPVPDARGGAAAAMKGEFAMSGGDGKGERVGGVWWSGFRWSRGPAARHSWNCYIGVSGRFEKVQRGVKNRADAQVRPFHSGRVTRTR